MCKNQWISSIIVGYSFSILAGHFIIKLIVGRMRQKFGLSNDSYKYAAVECIGFIERAMYTTSFLIGKPEFIAVWLTLKTAGQWKRWSEGQDGIEGRDIFNIFLIGNALSLFYGVIGAMIPEWWNKGDFILLIIIVLLGSLSLYIYLEIAYKRKQEGAIDKAEGKKSCPFKFFQGRPNTMNIKGKEIPSMALCERDNCEWWRSVGCAVKEIAEALQNMEMRK